MLENCIRTDQNKTTFSFLLAGARHLEHQQAIQILNKYTCSMYVWIYLQRIYHVKTTKENNIADTYMYIWTFSLLYLTIMHVFCLKRKGKEIVLNCFKSFWILTYVYYQQSCRSTMLVKIVSFLQGYQMQKEAIAECLWMCLVMDSNTRLVRRKSIMIITEVLN